MFYIYAMTNITNKVLYIGVTNNLKRRVFEHKNELVEGFTKKYKLHKLVYYEIYADAYTAISREKQLKRWKREKKNQLINTRNSEWDDLYEKL